MILQATSETGDRPGVEGGHQAQVKKMMMMMLMMMMIMTMMMPQGPPDTVQSLQHEIEVIKAKIAQEREKIRVGECDILMEVTSTFLPGQNSAASGGHRECAEHRPAQHQDQEESQGPQRQGGYYCFRLER